jgi:hypothetical protein
MGTDAPVILELVIVVLRILYGRGVGDWRHVVLVLLQVNPCSTVTAG